MAMNRRELELEGYRQRLFAHEAQQKADDVGRALELLLNDQFEPFYTNTTSDNGKHEFLFGIAKHVPIDDILGLLRTGSRTEDRRIILWKTTFGSCEVIASAYHDGEFKSLPKKLDGQAPELKKPLLEAIERLSVA